jgi:hypothetical protein
MTVGIEDSAVYEIHSSASSQAFSEVLAFAAKTVYVFLLNASEEI